MRLLTLGTNNTKTAKGEGQQYLTAILHLAPARLSGVNVCPAASKGCITSCLNTAGRGQFTSIQLARIKKTKRLFEDRQGFIDDLKHDIETLRRKAKRESKQVVIRLNGTSDLDWSILGIDFASYPDIQWYDYTKVFRRLKKQWPSNYHLTFSASESNDKDWQNALDLGFNVAMVFKEKLPTEFHGIKVISGENNDLRFTDPKVPNGLIIGLVAKGKAKKDTSGFVKEVKSCSI